MVSRMAAFNRLISMLKDFCSQAFAHGASRSETLRAKSIIVCALKV